VSEAPPSGSRAPLAGAALLFTLCGAGALIAQTLWLRELRLALGSASAALAATLAALVIGQAAGARLGGAVARGAPRPLRAFGALALLAALAAAATPVLLRAATAQLDLHYDALLARPAALGIARFAAALVATAPATLALGALAPALFAATLGGARTLARAGTVLYALNTLGSAFGAALATFALLERLGLDGALATGAAALAVTGAGALALSLRSGIAPPIPSASSGADSGAGPALLPRWLLGISALSGFGTFAAQGLFAQALGRVSNQSAYAQGAVLVAALSCLALGALFTASLSRRTRPLRALGVALAVSGAAFLMSPAYFVAASGGLTPLVSTEPWPAYLFDFATLALAAIAPVLLPAACVFPCLLAAAGAFAARDGRSFGAASARLLFWNAAGALLGAVLAPALLIPRLGLWRALALIGALYVLASLLPLARGVAPRFAAYAAVLGALLALVARPHAQPALRVPPGQRALAIEESAAGLVAVLEGADGRKLQLDNHYLLGGARDRVRQERQGHLPLLMHAAPRRVLFLGSATGSTASAALAHDVESITLVELVPGIERAARAWFRDENRGVHESPRARIVIDDARSFLRASRERFDVIVGDLFVPWHAGSGSLFSREHFANARARLAPGGVFCQWLPLYQLTREELLIIARSFAAVFPAADVFRGDFYGTHPIVALCGSGDDAAFDPWRVRARAELADRWLAHPAGPAALYVGRASAAWLGDGAVETDRAPVLELRAARAQSGLMHEPFTGLAWAEFAVEIAAAAPPGAAQADVRGGLLLQAASALYAARRSADAQAAFAAAAELLPAELVRDAPPDPSVAELWHTLSD
jgi:spermidine synthase